MGQVDVKIKQLDSIDALLASITSTFAGMNFQCNIVQSAAKQVARASRTQLNVVRSWETTIFKLPKYFLVGEHATVVHGSPGTRFQGKLKSKRVYLNCAGKLPTFCDIRGERFTFKVHRAWNWFHPWNGRGN